jgi:prepilin-type processing-associated H-X9-DG protein
MFRPTCRPRGAMTRIELLVMVTVIALLAALLIPAIVKVREASLRSQCANNLRQIGLAFHGYHDIYDVLPTGGRDTPTDPDCTFAAVKSDYSWCYQILPFIGQHALYTTTETTRLDTTPVPIYYCPARRSARLYHEHAVCDYGGNAGTDLLDGLDGLVVRTGAGTITIRRGIPAGASNVLMLGERRINLAYMETALDPHDNEPCFRYGWDGDGIRWARAIGSTWQTPAPDLNDATIPPFVPDYQYGSSHSAGMNACFADGSVRTLQFGVSAEIFHKACVRHCAKVSDAQECKR